MNVVSIINYASIVQWLICIHYISTLHIQTYPRIHTHSHAGLPVDELFIKQAGTEKVFVLM
jgi:hypothetical protein